MLPYLRPLVSLFEQNRDPSDAVAMAKYMRDQFEFLGIKSPQRRELATRFILENGYPEITQLSEVSRALWAQPAREYQYFAVDLLDKKVKQLTEDFIGLSEYLVITKSWWDTVDGLATHVIGGLMRRYPELQADWMQQWRRSENFWLRRTAILFQLNYKKHTDFSLLCSIIEENLESGEFFIQKAVGWALRQYSKTDATAVRDFVKNTSLAPLSEREALKWLKSKNRL